MAVLTKSNYLAGLQCSKLLWISKNAKDRLPEPDEIQQQKFRDGDKVQEIAERLFPEGVDLNPGRQGLSFKENLEETQKYINEEERRPIFEAGFLVQFQKQSKNYPKNKLFSRADILVPVAGVEGERLWDIIEVKMGTKVKDVNVHDVSFQKYVYQAAGLNIRNCYMMHVNNQFRKGEDSEINPEDFIVKTDITEDIKEIEKHGAEDKEGIGDIESRIEEMFRIIESEEPSCGIGIHCSDPYGCDISDECWKDVPEGSVFELYRIKKSKATELYNMGFKRIRDVPDDT